MKRIFKFKRILALCLLTFALCVNAQTDGKIVIIEGHFFSEVPVASTEINGMAMISAPSGSKAVLIRLANPLPEAALKFALPTADVPDADELLSISKTARVISMSVGETSDTAPKIAPGDKFPQFTATDIDGRTWSNKDVKGKAMVLNLWFTGCGPCRAEMPELSEWKDEMPDVMFFSVTYEDAATARPVIEKQGFNWIPIVGDTQFNEWIDSNGYPLTIVVDKAGTITHIEHGTSPLQREELKKQIQSVR